MAVMKWMRIAIGKRFNMRRRVPWPFRLETAPGAVNAP
jgi:hypothetical protein